MPADFALAALLHRFTVYGLHVRILGVCVWPRILLAWQVIHHRRRKVRALLRSAMKRIPLEFSCERREGCGLMRPVKLELQRWPNRSLLRST